MTIAALTPDVAVTTGVLGKLACPASITAARVSLRPPSGTAGGIRVRPCDHGPLGRNLPAAMQPGLISSATSVVARTRMPRVARHGGGASRSRSGWTGSVWAQVRLPRGPTRLG